MSTVQAIAQKYPLRLKITSRIQSAIHDWRAARVKRLLRKLEGDSNYVKHCRRELHSWFADDKDSPNRWMAEHIESTLMMFALEGHSGSSAPFAVAVFKELASFKPWGPLTGAEDEWGESYDGKGSQQNKRRSRVFRDAGGKAYDIDGRVFREPNGACYTNRNSRVYIEFPYTPKTEYVDVPLKEETP